MSTFIFAGFESMSEFVPRNPDGTPKRRGDCGPLAVLLCLHVRDPKRWPLTPAALDALVNDMAAKGCLMRADGESNIPGLDRYLQLLGVPHVTVGYANFTLDGLHQHLKALATPDPRLVLVEWSAAGKGLHDDEANVAYHYSAFGGIDTMRGYYRGDGDSSTDDRGGKPTSAILTGWSDIEAAKPVGYIVIDVPATLKPHPAPVSVPPAPAVPPKPAPVPTPATAQPVAPAASTAASQEAYDGILNLIKLFKLATAYASLNPTQRAVLRFLEGIGCTVLVAVAPAFADVLAGRPVDWGTEAHAAVAAAGVAFLMALVKYAKAHKDPAL